MAEDLDIDGCVQFVLHAIKLARKDAENGDEEAAQFLEVLQTVAKPKLATQAPQSSARQPRRTT